MEHQWIVRSRVDIPSGLLEHVHENQTVASYLIRRGITSTNEANRYLNPIHGNLTSPHELPGIPEAVARIVRAINDHEKIGVWGDFDVDGQTATAILVECLRKLGTNTVYYLPDRRTESHGISISSLQQFLKQNIQILITCDTGISEHRSIEFAMQNGVDVIVTDHHTLSETLPPALACVNPRRLNKDHLLASLSGSGVAFELMLAVSRFLDREDVAFESIDLACVGLVADVSPLVGDSRLIAQLGLKYLKEKPRRCIRALVESSNSVGQSMDEQFIGYTIAPRLNAVGRLENANPVVEFLMDSLPEPEMKGLVERIEAINADRKWLCDQVYQSALDQLQSQKDALLQPVILLSHPTWTGGVLGLAAGKLARDFNRPAIVLTETPEGLMKGSARSIDGVNITEAITAASEFLTGFGGHPMAAGLSFRSELIDSVRQTINKQVLSQGFRTDKPPEMEIDEELAFSDITPHFFSEIHRLAPFGNQNPPLVFCTKNLSISSMKPLGRNREHFQFILEDEAGRTLPAKWWNTEENQIPEGRFDLAYSLNLNTYKGETTLEAVWIDSHLLEEPERPIFEVDSSRVIDLRSEQDPLSTAINTYAKPPFLIFQEPPLVEDPISCGRYGLRRVNTLVFASIPPSRQVLVDIIQHARPDQVILIFNQNRSYSTESFLHRLAGYIKYAVNNREGLASLKDLAQAMNSTIEVVISGLEWWVADGKITIQNSEEDLYRLEIRKQPADDRIKDQRSNLLRYQLNEITAYQKFLANLPVDQINEML